MNDRWTLATGGLLMAAATVAGALGAHALHDTLPPQRLEIYETAVRYHFYHALGLLAIGLAARGRSSALFRWSATLVVIGVVLFSGSLYALTFGAPRVLGVVTPLGGLALIAGWIVFAIGALRRSDATS